MSSVFDDLLVDVTPTPVKITGRDLPIGERAQEELEIWMGRTENDPQMFDHLQKYWDFLGEEWTISKPWSGAFVSWLLQDQEFPGDALHAAYVRKIIEGESPSWSAYDANSNVEINIGDVYVRRRSGGYWAGHGDVVYRIDETLGRAYLIGGNQSNTVAITSIPIDGNNNYDIVLKKSAGQKKNLWIIPVMLGAVWILRKS